MFCRWHACMFTYREGTSNGLAHTDQASPFFSDGQGRASNGLAHRDICPGGQEFAPNAAHFWSRFRVGRTAARSAPMSSLSASGSAASHTLLLQSIRPQTHAKPPPLPKLLPRDGGRAVQHHARCRRCPAGGEVMGSLHRKQKFSYGCNCQDRI